MKSRGSILIVSLWVLGILFLLAVGLAYRVGLELRMTRYAQDRLKAFYIAKAGLERAMTVLVEEDSGEPDSFKEAWSQDESLFKENGVGDGFFSVSYSLQESNEERELRYGMQDEESRIPLNPADPSILQKIPGLDEEIILSIQAWRGDPNLTPDVLAREDDYYASLGKPYTRKGKPFESLEELLLVKGMTPALFEEMKKTFTVYGSRTVNLNTASADVLTQLGLEASIAQRIVETRKGEDGLLGTEDDIVLEAVGDLTTKMASFLRLDQDQQLALSNFLAARQQLLTVQSTAFRVQVEGRLLQGGVKKRIVAVVDRGRRVHYWHED